MNTTRSDFRPVTTPQTKEAASDDTAPTRDKTPAGTASVEDKGDGVTVPAKLDPRTAAKGLSPERGGYDGPEPTRYGDWEHKGRATDF